MPAIKFEKDQVLLLKPTKITNTGKPVHSTVMGGDCIRYDIEFEDKNKNTGKAEFLCRKSTCEDFVEGVFCYVKVLWLAGRGDATIAPCEPPGEQTRDVQRSQPKETHIVDTRDTPRPNPFNVSVNGKATTYAMAYAKDILVAEIARRADGAVTDSDIDRMVAWGAKIANSMTEQLDF